MEPNFGRDHQLRILPYTHTHTHAKRERYGVYDVSMLCIAFVFYNFRICYLFFHISNSFAITIQLFAFVIVFTIKTMPRECCNHKPDSSLDTCQTSRSSVFRRDERPTNCLYLYRFFMSFVKRDEYIKTYEICENCPSFYSKRKYD